MNYYDAAKRQISNSLERPEMPRGRSPFWWLISALVFFPTIGGTLFALEETPPTFRATAQLLVLLSDEYAAKPVPGSETKLLQTVLDRDAYMSAESNILVSVAVIERSISQLGPERVYPHIGDAPGFAKSIIRSVSDFVNGFKLEPSDSAKLVALRASSAVQKSLHVDIGSSGNLITITYDNADREMSARFLSVLVENYFARRAALFSDEQLKSLRHEVEVKGQELAKARASLEIFRKRHAISDFSLQRELLLRQLSNLTKDLQDSQAASEEAQARSNTVRLQLSALTPAFVRQVDGAKVAVRNGNIATNLQEEANKLEQAIAAAKARQVGLLSRVEEGRAQLRSLTELDGELRNLKLREDVLERQYAQGLQTLFERDSVNTVSQAVRSNVKLLDNIVVPSKPTSQRLLIAVSGFLLAMFMAFAVVLAGAFSGIRWKSEDTWPVSGAEPARWPVSIHTSPAKSRI